MDYHPHPWGEDHTTVQHHIMIKKHFDMPVMSKGPRPVPNYQGLLNNRHFFVQLNNKKSKGKAPKNSLPQGRPLDCPLSSWMSPPSTNYFPYNAAVSSMLTTSVSPLNRRIPEDWAWSALQAVTTFNNHLKCNPSKNPAVLLPPKKPGK